LMRSDPDPTPGFIHVRKSEILIYFYSYFCQFSFPSTLYGMYHTFQ
jgi:hypothetical protein